MSETGKAKPKVAPRVLIVTTSHGRMGDGRGDRKGDGSGDDGGKRTGLWLEELAAPYSALRRAGVAVEIASPRGGAVPIDPRSVKPRGENPAVVEHLLDDPEAASALATSRALADVDWEQFDAAFFPGGHGTMWDLPVDPQVGRLVAHFARAGRPVASVCHGPAALVGARDEGGAPVVAGRTITSFSDSEERAAGLAEVVPFLLETRLRELGATVKTGPNFQPFALRDGFLITGQNPASSERVAELLLEALAESSPAGRMR